MTFSEAMAYGAPMPSVAERDDLKAEQAMPRTDLSVQWHSLFLILLFSYFFQRFFQRLQIIRDNFPNQLQIYALIVVHNSIAQTV